MHVTNLGTCTKVIERLLVVLQIPVTIVKLEMDVKITKFLLSE